MRINPVSSCFEEPGKPAPYKFFSFLCAFVPLWFKKKTTHRDETGASQRSKKKL